MVQAISESDEPKRDHPVTECTHCSKAMNNIAEKGFQPMGGLAFSTRGHYGSTYFDPMDGSYLEIAICDDCVKLLVAGDYVYRSDESGERTQPEPRETEVEPK